MVAQTQIGTMTADQFWELYEGKPFELVNGIPRALEEDIGMSPTGLNHMVIAAKCIHVLQTFVDAYPIGYVASSEGGFLLAREPDIIRGADAAFIRFDRIPANADMNKYCPVAPDLAVEVVSPSDRAGEIMEKVDLYIAGGTRLVWVIYPDLKQVVVYHPSSDAQRLSGTDHLDGGDVLPGLNIPLAALWPPDYSVHEA